MLLPNPLGVGADGVEDGDSRALRCKEAGDEGGTSGAQSPLQEGLGQDGDCHEGFPVDLVAGGDGAYGYDCEPCRARRKSGAASG